MSRRFCKPFEKSLNQPAVDTDELSRQLRNGDLVFISVINPLYKHVAKVSDSLATHVGIAFRDDVHGWLIAESTVPFAKYTALNKYLRRSRDGWVAVRRVASNLNASQINSLRDACDRRMGGLYGFGFNYDSRRLYCSKFVYDSYLEGLSIEVGSIQSFESLLKPQTDQSLWFWRLWFFGVIPWARRTVTPANQLNTAKFKVAN